MEILMIENRLESSIELNRLLSSISSETFHIIRAEKLSSAVDLMKKHDFHVIITDLNLPDNSGVGIIRDLCQHAMKIPVIVLTDLSDDSRERAAMKAGAQDYLVRNRVDAETLYKAIQHSIDRKMLDWQLRLARRRLRILHDAASGLEVCSMKKKAFKLALDAASSLVPGALFQIFTEKDGELFVEAASADLESTVGSRADLDFGLADMTLAEKRTFQFTSNYEGSTSSEDEEAFRSGMSIPIGSDAVFLCLSNEPDAFSNDDTNMLEMLTGHLSGTVDRISLARKLRNLAIHDPLTGVFNRNFFQIALKREKLRAERYDSSIGFLMVDIDNFKDINDIYGHLAGDKVLREVARYLSESIRETDYLIRYGGDEFIMILIETGQTASLVRDRILGGTGLAERTIKLLGNPVTLSVGHSHWNSSSGVSIRETLAEADKKMYRNKRERKNR